MSEHYCDKCKKKTKFQYYHGMLGYESFTCERCGEDINDIIARKKRK